MSEFIDITRPIDSSLPLWPGRSLPTQHWEKQLEYGHHCNASSIQMSLHSGTHMDAPLHFVDDALSIGRIPTEFFMGECVVVDLRSEPDAQLNVRLAKSYRGVKRVLLRTHHSNATKSSMYQPHGRLLTPEAISFLLDNGLQLLGTDRLSIDDSSGRDYHLHQLVLGTGSIILEGLLLSHVVPGEYILSAAPLLLPEAEASPVRAFLIRK